MRLKMFKNSALLFIFAVVSCGNFSSSETLNSETTETHSDLTQVETKDTSSKARIIVGANRTEDYLKHLKGKSVGIVANQSSVIFKADSQDADPKQQTHLVDSLLALQVNVKSVFAPEHGFRGTADAGETITDGLDPKTGLKIVSLYGSNKKPTAAQLKGIDIMVFDLQDVGVRFYTYISSLHYVMEACAEAGIPVLVLDRPNPNGHYIDGPILEKEFESFVGMHPIPTVHGMTIGEYAQMINGQKWLDKGLQCELTVIPVKNYTHQTSYSLPIKPSPNLPNDKSINLYPSLCFFEGTNVSVGRGTSKQFQIFGSPYLYKDYYTFKFVPQPNLGAKTPLHKGNLCYGKDLSDSEHMSALDLDIVIEAYHHSVDKPKFFNNFFDKLAGTAKLQQQIKAGQTSEQIKATWTEGLKDFKNMRKPYLIY